MVEFPAGTVAYSYVRMSSMRQAQGDSIRRQTERSIEFAARNGLKLDDTLRDIGVSAWNGDNKREGALSNFLNLVVGGKIAKGSVLLIEALDRLSREKVLDALEVFLQILKAGITIVTVKDGQVYSRESVGDNWSQLIISLSIMARAHEESQQKSDRVRAAAENRRRLAMNGIGKFSQNIPGWLTQVRSGKGQISYELNEHANTIREVFRMASEGIGYMSIAKILNAKKTPTYRGAQTKWHVSSISDICRNHAAYGVLIPRRKSGHEMITYGDPIPGYYPAVIDKDLFEKAFRAKARRATRGRKGDKFSNLFTGMNVCAHCGGNMIIHRSGPTKNPYSYIRCYSAWMDAGCKHGTKPFRYDKLENAILDAVREFNISDYPVPDTHNDEIAEIERDISIEEQALRLIETREDNLILELSIAEDAMKSAIRRVLHTMPTQRDQHRARLNQLITRRAIIEGRRKDFVDIDAVIKVERARWSEMDDADLYQSRNRVHVALKRVFQMLSFDSNQNVAYLIMANGLKAYRFQDGKLLDTFDAIRDGHILNQPGSMTLDHFTSDLGPLPDDLVTEADEKELRDRQALIRKFVIARNKGSLHNWVKPVKVEYPEQEPREGLRETRVGKGE